MPDTDNVATKLADVIRELRTSRGLTQQQLADCCGLKQSSVQQWESGSQPDLARFPDMDRCFGAPLGTVLRAAGLVGDDVSVRDRILFDPNIDDPELRQQMVKTYDVYVRASGIDLR